MYIIIAFLAISILIIVHELGHFIMAKVNGVQVEEFSLGMGPKICGFKKKGTEYNFKLFPIGGYVRMLGEEEENEGNPKAFCNKTPFQRLSIFIAGPLMNLILAIVIFTFMTFNIGYVSTKISGFVDGSPAQEMGLNVGDDIIAVNGTKTRIWDDITYKKDNPIDITVNRNGEVKEFTITPYLNKEENRYLIGISPQRVDNPGIGESLNQGIKEMGSLIKQTYSAVGTLITGKGSMDDVGGPVSIVKISAAAAKAGIWSLLRFLAYLSLQLGILNLLPFPALDGGMTVILLIEIISRKKLSNKVVGTLNYIGFSILILLSILVAIKDILFPINI